MRLSLRNSLVSLGLLALLGAPARADDPPTVRLTLREALDIARTQSPSAIVALHRYRGSYWQFTTFRSDYRPLLNINSAPASLDRTISEQTLPDGTDAFVRRSQANSSVELSLSKVVSWSGGTLALRTNVARTDPLEGEGVTSYFATPVAVSYDQPLFAINNLAWGLRVEPLRWQEARQAFTEDLEWISASTISSYFDLLTAQSALLEAQKAHDRAETLLVVMRRRFAAGQQPENDVLQAQLGSLNADIRVARAQVDLDVKQQALATLLGLGEAPKFDLAPATDVPRPTVDLRTAQAEARRNRATAMSWKRQRLEADRQVAAARASRGYASLHASYGLSQTTTELPQLWHHPETDQVAQVSLNLPVLDWGRAQARVAVAESQREVTVRQLQQAQADFDRDVFLKFSQFQIQETQLRLATLADSIAQRRYDVTRQKVLSGQGDLTSLDIAQGEMDGARRGYFDALRSYWSAYADLRRVSLYDWEHGHRLEAPEVRF